jgi:hypothetical protein
MPYLPGRHRVNPLADQRSLTAVETGERYADGLVYEEERQAAWEAARRVVEDTMAEQGWEQAAGAVAAWRCIETEKYLLVGLDHPGSVWHPQQCWLFRELFGPLPFRPVTIDPSWLVWQDGTVRNLAQAIYEDRAFDRLPILGDALEEAGCDNPDTLTHCRQPGPHVRGCWVVDMILGKE